jgi:hypothetical protein
MRATLRADSAASLNPRPTPAAKLSGFLFLFFALARFAMGRAAPDFRFATFVAMD